MKSLTLLVLYICLPPPACYGFSSIPLWTDLQSRLDRPLPRVYVDEIPSSDANLDGSAELPILYRDKECICASSQTVWLAMECKNIDYITVLVSKEDDQRVPRVVWPDCDDDVATNSEHAIEILEQIQARYPDKDPPFYPKLSAAVDASRCNIMRLPGVMPRNSDPNLMDLAPYLFREDGTKVQKSSHTVSLEEIEEMQEEYYLGSYLCGKDVTAADMVWGPYLERYAIQLPMVMPNLKSCSPRSKMYEEVSSWYVTMERNLPEYSCCVQGDARHWRSCLERAVKVHNSRVEVDDEYVQLPPAPIESGWWMVKNPSADQLWREYTKTRPWLGDTPGEEVALHLLRNRDELIRTASESLGISSEATDEALRELINYMASWTIDKSECVDISAKASRLVTWLSEHIQIPKDIPMIPALALGEVAMASLPIEEKIEN
mmetsp:Transcript_34362/g.82172  ORF Transcript_34362/g.82172 Transcript_34362/m.82172 type:complete len:434 (+) Transcript_34362:191-1492(+)